jgi:hypothetical protein
MFTKNQTRGRQAVPREYHDDFVEIVDPFDEENTPPAEKAGRSKRLGYMAELEKWLEDTVFEPFTEAIAAEDNKELQIAFNEGKQLIKQKVLASYHNGLKARTNAR